MDRLKATARITANSSQQEQRMVRELNISGFENVQSNSSGSTFEVTADAPCNPPRQCGATIFRDKGITDVRRCSGCQQG